MALDEKTKLQVSSFLKDKLLNKINGYKIDAEEGSKPFQYALFTEKGYLVKGFIHGCETALGNWHEAIALIIARQNFAVAKKLQGAYKLKGKITLQAQGTYENILSKLDDASREPNHASETAEIFSASSNKENLIPREQTVDLYLQRSNGEEIYLEIKGPKPNKNEMRAAKRDLFEIYAMRAAEGIMPRVILGMYYNPYYPSEYARWTCLKFFEKGTDLLVGKDFWDFLGGVGTYEQLIAIYESVGEDVRPILEEKLLSISAGY